HEPAAGRVLVSPQAQPGYLAQESAPADGMEDTTPLDVLRGAAPLSEVDAANFLHRFLFGHDQVRTPLARLSYGERRRLELARLVLGGAGLLLLDEPTNHLDLPAREAFESALEDFEGGALIVTHDRWFMERFADRVLAVEDGQLSVL